MEKKYVVFCDFPLNPTVPCEILEDVISYNATISSCQKADEWRMSLEILRAVAEAMVESNNITGWVASKKHNPVTPLLSEPSLQTATDGQAMLPLALAGSIGFVPRTFFQQEGLSRRGTSAVMAGAVFWI